MALDPSNLLSTPEGYATPSQIQQVQAYSKALLEQSRQPVHHWTQGLSNMVAALVGGHKQYEAGKREQVGHNWEGNAAIGGPGSGYENGTDTSTSDAGSDLPSNTSLAELRAPHADTLRNDPQTRRALMASTNAEVGGQGPDAELGYMEATLHRALAEGRPILDVVNDRRYYPRTTQAKLGRSIDPEDEKRYAGHIEKYLAGSNISNLATGNESGTVRSGGAEITYNPRTGERFVAENWTKPWRDRVLASLKQPTSDTQPTQILNPNDQGAEVSKALAFAGPGAPGAPDEGNVDLARAMQVAQAGPQAARSGAVGSGGPSSAGPPIGGAATVDPSTLPTRPSVTDRQMRDLIRNPWVDPMIKALKLQQYYSQGQPQLVPTDYGGQVVVPGVDQYGRPKGSPRLLQPPLEEKATHGPEGIAIPNWYRTIIGPNGPVKIKVPKGTPGAVPGPQSDASPTAPPAAQTPLGTPAPTEVPGNLASGTAPNPEEGAPVKVAALGDWVPSTPPPPGVLSADPPVKVAGGPNLLPTPEGGSNMTSSGDPEVDQMSQFATRYKEENKKREAAAAANQKWGETTMETGRSANQALEDIPMAKSLVEDPNFKPGTMAELKLSVQKFLATFGLADPKLAAPAEALKKLISDLNLSDLKTKLGGLGQVRVFEGQLVNQANFNITNTRAAIRFLLEAKERTARRDAHISEQAAEYEAKHGAIDGNFRAWTARQYKQNLFTPEELKDHMRLMEADPAFKYIGGKKPIDLITEKPASMPQKDWDELIKLRNQRK